MLFVTYRIELTFENDLEKLIEGYKDLIRENRSRYWKYDATFEIEEIENDDSDESITAAQFANLELKNDESNFELEMNMPKLN